MADYVKLSKYGIEFKNLISGPAPVGRILNYLNLVGNGRLKHKNGHRVASLDNGVASAWCSEFMIGLGLITYDPSETQPAKLFLTENGKKLFLETSKFHGNYSEEQDPAQCRRELLNVSPSGYKIFKNIFLISPVFLNLKAFIENKGRRTFPGGKTFHKLYWEEFLNIYSNSESFDPNARTSAGDNRVPSLIQLCMFFKICILNGTNYVFNLPQKEPELNNINPFRDQTSLYSNDKILETLSDFEDDNAIRNASTYESQDAIDSADARTPVLKPGLSSNNRYTTDPRLGKTVLVNSGWKCCLSGFDGHEHTTFSTKNGNNYLEAHHLVPMKAQKDFMPINLDIYDNIIPLCPNCHKAVHYGSLEEKRRFLKPLYDARISKLNEHGIFISFEDLINKYYD